MNPFKTLKKVRDEVKISSIYPITHLNSPSVFETKEGLLGTVIRLEGIPFATELPERLNALSNTLHQALSCLDERFIAYVTVHRKKENIVLEGAFSSPLAARINDKYHARFKGANLYKNNLYLTLVLKGDTSNKSAKVIHWLKRALDAGSSVQANVHRLENLNQLTNTANQILSSLSKFRPHLLGDADDSLGYSELLAFLSLIPNAGEAVHFQKPTYFSPISKTLAETFLDEERYPEGHLGQYVSTKQVIFGETLQFQGATNNDVQFGAMLSIKKYGKTKTSSSTLDPLLSLNTEFISTHTFAPLPRDSALDQIRLKRDKLNNAGDLSTSQIDDLSDLDDDIASEKARLGFHHNTLMLIAPSQKQLEKAVNEAVKAYAYADMVAIKETPLGAEPAFWAQIPGAHAFIARASLITSHNFVDFCPLHNYQTGFKDKNHLGGAVTLLETPSKTPVFFNYHGKSSTTNPAKGHALLFGGNNAGKTTLVSFLDSQMGRYNNRSFFLDRDQASKIYILGSGNSRYLTIAPRYHHQCRMNPLQLPDTPENRTFLKTWMAQLIKQPLEEELPRHLSEIINECINYNFEHLASPYRTLSHLAKFLPVDFPRWPELRCWLKGDDTRGDGEYSWLFDNEQDVLEFDFDKVGFDITYLMDEVTHLISTPVYLYLVHRMRQSLDGRLTSFVIDEAFQVFNSPFWVMLLRNWLPTIRKKNGHFIFMTQSPQTVLESAIRATILDNVATTILFPNPQADHNTYVNHLNLSESEYEVIKNNEPESRLFLFKQENEAILCKLDLSPLSDEVRILSGNTKSVALLDSLMERLGDATALWMPAFIERSAA